MFGVILFGAGIQHAQAGRAAGFQLAGQDAQAAGGGGRHRIQGPGQCQLAVVHQLQHQAKQGIQPGHARLGGRERGRLAGRTNGGVLGADGINGTVGHRLQQGLTIRRTAQGRDHVAVAVEPFQGRFIQQQVLNAHVRRHRQAATLGGAQ